MPALLSRPTAENTWFHEELGEPFVEFFERAGADPIKFLAYGQFKRVCLMHTVLPVTCVVLLTLYGTRPFRRTRETPSLAGSHY